jgi:PAS domain S-box-containing protein
MISTHTVLVIEDFAPDRDLYRCWLLGDPSCTYHILEANCAAVGLELCQAQAIDVILLDYLLPDMDGLAFLEALRVQSKGSTPPVVMVTGGGNEKVAVQAIKLGVEDYLVKSSLTPELLQLALRCAIEKAQLQQQLEESENRYQAIVEDQTELICRFSPDCTLTFVNRAYSAYFESTYEQLIGRNFLDFIPESHRTAVQQHMADLSHATPENAVVSYEHPVLKSNGEISWQDWTNRAVFGAGGRVIEIQSVGRDVGDRNRVKAERDASLAQAQAAREEAEVANNSKDQFVAMVAHELRSPLNSIMGWAKLMQSRKLDAATQAKALSTIIRNTETQVQLVEDLLDISRMVRGTLQIALTPVNWVSVLEAAIDIVRPMADAKQVHLETHFAIAPKIAGDSNRLQQIVINLLTNAVKFTPQQGRVDVYLEQVETQAQLRICDTGKGIAPEFLPLIFEQFQQGQQNTEAKDGLGLGLAIAKNLVELHAGTIAAESNGLGQGATFIVRLPILSAIAKDTIPVSTTPASLAGIRVLVVDDEPDMLNLITFVLAEAGADVQPAMKATDALKQLPLFQPNILISDISMPGSNGYELLQQIRSQPNGNIPAIALTAYASSTYEERSLQAGFQQHFTKPVEAEDLIAAIINLVKANNLSA